MKHLFLTSLFFCITSYAFSQWIPQNSNTTQAISDIHFIDNSLGFASGSNGTILKSDDGGENWQNLMSNSSHAFNCVFGVDINNIFVGRLSLKTTTNGNSFFDIGGLDSLGGVKDIHFFNNSDGLILNSGGVLKTNDGGSTWASTIMPVNSNAPLGQLWVNDFQFINPNSGFAFGGLETDSINYGVLYKTIGGGNVWTDMNFSGKSITACYFSDVSTGYYTNNVVGNASIYKTVNGGSVWSLLSTFTNERITDIMFYDELVGYTTSVEGHINKTTDGGLTWENVHSTSGSALVDIEKTPDHTILIAGEDGLILKNEELVLSTAHNDFSDFANVFYYPNDMINIEFNHILEEVTKIELFNVNGQQIFVKTTISKQNQINIEPYSKGVYILKISSNNGIYCQKVVID